MRVFLGFLVLAALSVTASAAERQIGYVQQEKPGELIMVSVVQSGKKTAVVVDDFRKGGDGKVRPIAKEAFEVLWAAFTGPEAARFVFTPGPSDSMADPRFYTVKAVGAGKSSSLRIPRGEKSAPLSKAVTTIKAWINEN